MDYYSRLTDMNVLYSTALKSVKGINWKCSVQRYESMILPNLYQLRKELINGTYKPGKSVEFDICERGKNRHIISPAFRDKILQRAISENVLEPALLPHIIYRNGASIKGKGVSFARRELRKMLYRFYQNHGNKGYILIGDYSKFFDSIPHDKLLDAIGKIVQDERFMKLLEQIMKEYNPSGVGLAIGAHISQICGVFYPTPIDNYITCVMGCKNYIRHMDDFVILSDNKDFLYGIKEKITQKSAEYGLKINQSKTQVCRIDKGFRFLKCRISVSETGKIIEKPCKDNIKREKRKLRKFKEKLENGETDLINIRNQYLGWRGTMEEFDCENALHNMDIEFVKMFGNAEECLQCKYKNRNLSDEPCCRCSDFLGGN